MFSWPCSHIFCVIELLFYKDTGRLVKVTPFFVMAANWHSYVKFGIPINFLGSDFLLSALMGISETGFVLMKLVIDFKEILNVVKFFIRYK